MSLTKKQLEVFRLKKEGLTNREISRRLSKSESYISQVLSRITTKIRNMEDTIQILTQLGEFEDRPRYGLSQEAKLSPRIPEWVKSIEPFRSPKKPIHEMIFRNTVKTTIQHGDKTCISIQEIRRKHIYAELEFSEKVRG
ncbi:MAG: LuxR C-terminal-related transcriptional regulator [Candidatus Bathyarchaeota archaeon]|nr:LuxR C-terminal-related transcriptional regulator [Candidatus Bathyarchaeota archaeon]